MDDLTKEQRHKAMTSIRSKDTGIEMKLRKALWQRGYRYRKNYAALPGKPDIVLTKYKIAVFCDSEFFHGKDWYTVLQPKIRQGVNPEYWEKKIARNMERDNEINQKLNYLGWTVIRFWGKEIYKNAEECVAIIEECIFEQKVSNADFLFESSVFFEDFEEKRFNKKLRLSHAEKVALTAHWLFKGKMSTEDSVKGYFVSSKEK